MKCETELSTYWPNLWVKLILLGNFNKNSLIIFEHKSRDHKSWYTPYPGATQANCIPWAGSVGPWPWNLHQVLLPLPLTKACAIPVEPCSVLQLGDGWFTLLWAGWDGNRGTIFESSPHWGSHFWLASREMKTIIPHLLAPCPSPQATMKINMLFLKHLCTVVSWEKNQQKLINLSSEQGFEDYRRKAS